MEVLNHLSGYLVVRITGFSPERFLNMCNHHDISIWNLKNDGNSYLLHMHASDFKKLRKIVKKTHMKVRIEEKHGLPFWLFRYRKRKLFFSGILCSILLLFFLSLHIWNIEITGNSYETDETILSYLRTQGVYDGMWKKDVQCAEIAAALREDFNNLTWVSVSLDGTKLTIKVKENQDTLLSETGTKEISQSAAEENTDSTSGTDLIADKSGTVISVITRSGTPLVHSGDRIKKGASLVTGRIDILNDAKEVVGYRYVDSHADVIIQSGRKYSEKLPYEYKNKTYTGKEQKGYYLNVFDYQFFLGTKTSSYKQGDQLVREHQIRLSDSFYLPVYYGVKTYREYTYEKTKYTKDEAKRKLSDDFQVFCRNLAEKGVEITENSVKIHVGKNEAEISGTLTVREKATKRKKTKIAPLPEQTEVQEETQ